MFLLEQRQVLGSSKLRCVKPCLSFSGVHRKTHLIPFGSFSKCPGPLRAEDRVGQQAMTSRHGATARPNQDIQTGLQIIDRDQRLTPTKHALKAINNHGNPFC